MTKDGKFPKFLCDTCRQETFAALDRMEAAPGTGVSKYCEHDKVFATALFRADGAICWNILSPFEPQEMTELAARVAEMRAGALPPGTPKLQ